MATSATTTITVRRRLWLSIWLQVLASFVLITRVIRYVDCWIHKHNTHIYLLISQDLLASEQSSIIIKSLTKLPKNFNIVVYPCLVTIIYKNEEARKSIAREFNVDVSANTRNYFPQLKALINYPSIPYSSWTSTANPRRPKRIDWYLCWIQTSHKLFPFLILRKTFIIYLTWYLFALLYSFYLKSNSKSFCY